MNTHLFRSSALLAIIGLILVAPFVVRAIEYRIGEQPNLAAGEKVIADLYMAGGNVTASGEVGGDLWTAGGNIIISSPVGQDAVATGGSISVLSAVGDDARFVGGSVLLQGGVGGDLLIGGGQVTIGGAGIRGDAIIGGGAVRIEAPIAGDLLVGGGEVYLNAQIGGDVKIVAEKVTLGSQAVIAGNLSYSSPKAATLEEGAVVNGETVYTERTSAHGAAKAGMAAALTIWTLMKLMSIFVAALVIGLFVQRYSLEIISRAVSAPWSRLGVGLSIFVLLPIVSVALLFTVVGTIFGIVGLLVYVLLLTFSVPIASIIIGSVLHKLIWKPASYVVNWKTILLGSFVYSALFFVPIIGGLLAFAAIFVTLGAMMSIKREVIQNWQ